MQQIDLGVILGPVGSQSDPLDHLFRPKGCKRGGRHSDPSGFGRNLRANMPPRHPQIEFPQIWERLGSYFATCLAVSSCSHTNVQAQTYTIHATYKHTHRNTNIQTQRHTHKTSSRTRKWQEITNIF